MVLNTCLALIICGLIVHPLHLHYVKVLESLTDGRCLLSLWTIGTAHNSCYVDFASKGGFITVIDGTKVLHSRQNVVYVANSVDSIDGFSGLVIHPPDFLLGHTRW